MNWKTPWSVAKISWVLRYIWSRMFWNKCYRSPGKYTCEEETNYFSNASWLTAPFERLSWNRRPKCESIIQIITMNTFCLNSWLGWCLVFIAWQTRVNKMISNNHVCLSEVTLWLCESKKNNSLSVSYFMLGIFNQHLPNSQNNSAFGRYCRPTNSLLKNRPVAVQQKTSRTLSKHYWHSYDLHKNNER